MKMMKFILVSLLLIASAQSKAVTVSAEAFGSPSVNPLDALAHTELINGDFVITQDPLSCCSTLLGDGNNDDTAWTFDFGSDANLLSSETLSSALLTLSLVSVTGGVSSDTIEIVGLGGRAATEIRSQTPGVDTTYTFDLLNYYSSEAILNELFADEFGKLNLIYEDDALVHYAQLSLSTVPVPAAFWLFGTAIVGFAGFSKYRKTA